MMPGFAYRGFAPGDTERLAELCGELGYPSSGADVASRLDRLLGSPEHLVLVAVDGSGVPVGWLHAYLAHRVASDAFAEVGGLVVSEGHRDAGIGAELLARAEEWAHSADVSTLRVRSNVIRERAHRFYLRAGYAQVKTSHVFSQRLDEQGSGHRLTT